MLPASVNYASESCPPASLTGTLKAVTRHNGPATAKMTKSVLSGMCGLAARHDAIDRNPVRDAGPIKMPTKSVPKALSVEDARLLIKRLAADDVARARDVPDLVRFMLATGVRIGEAAAVTWDVVDLDCGTVAITRTVVRVRHQGLLAKETKTDAGQRTLELPAWATEMLAARDAGTTGPVFPAPKGGWRDPSNTQGDLRDAFAAADFGWVTSHVLRKTVATVMDQAGLSSRAAADQLGHVNPSMTADVYMGRRVAATGAARPWPSSTSGHDLGRSRRSSPCEALIASRLDPYRPGRGAAR